MIYLIELLGRIKNATSLIHIGFNYLPIKMVRFKTNLQAMAIDCVKVIHSNKIIHKLNWFYNKIPLIFLVN